MEQKNEGMLHQGLAFRNFKHSFNLADHVKVASELVREILEQLKPRRIEVGSTVASQDNQPRLADDQPELQRRVA
jgi:molecular chaperone IbpA